jgi:ketosteroid isomerase-like protein
MNTIVKENEALIHHFYTCFKNMDYKGMQDCYADNAVFNDAVFNNLNADEVKAMWRMLITSAQNLHIEFNQPKGELNTVTAHWDAYYTFSKTNRKVINRIDAIFEIEDGKIVKHTDQFSFYTWAKQAFGVTGLLLGWTNFLKNKVQATVKNNLDYFMKKTK